MSLTTWGANHHLDRVYGSGEPATLYLAVMSEQPTTLTTGAGLAEPVGNGYARVAITNNSTSFSGAADGVKTNALDITFPQATGAWGTMRFWALCTAATEGNIVSWGKITPRFVNTNSSIKFSRDQLVITAR